MDILFIIDVIKGNLEIDNTQEAFLHTSLSLYDTKLYCKRLLRIVNDLERCLKLE